MSEFEAESTAEQPSEVEVSVENNSQQGKPEGYDPVDPKTAAPEEVEARIKYLYRQVKDNGRALHDYRSIAEQQSAKIEELMSGMGTVVGHLQEKTMHETESQLKEQLRTAFESGDTKTYVETQDKLDDIRLERKLAARQPSAPKQEQKPAPQQSYNEPLVNDDDLRFIDAWQDERDNNGNLLRPWAHNQSNDPNYADPNYEAALLEMQAVLKSPKYKNKSMEEKVAEVDRRMGLQKSTTTQAVLGGNLTGTRKTAKIALSPRQQDIALRTVPLSSKIKSDADKIEWYRQQLEKVNKGARK